MRRPSSGTRSRPLSADAILAAVLRPGAPVTSARPRWVPFPAPAGVVTVGSTVDQFDQIVRSSWWLAAPLHATSSPPCRPSSGSPGSLFTVPATWVIVVGEAGLPAAAKEAGERLGVDLGPAARGPARRPGSPRPPGATAAYPLLTGEVAEVLLVGAGDGTPADLRHAGAAIARFGRGKDELTTVVAEGIDDAGLQAFAEGDRARLVHVPPQDRRPGQADRRADRADRRLRPPTGRRDRARPGDRPDRLAGPRARHHALEREGPGLARRPRDRARRRAPASR